MDAHRREVLIACLRRVDRGDTLDSVILEYPEEAGWLREHLVVSDALQMAGEPSAEKKSRVRESLLSAVADSAASPNAPSSLRFRFALMQVALIVVSSFGVAVGAAAASGMNLRSVAEDVVDSLVEPLPLSAPLPTSAEGPQAPIGLDPVEQSAGDDPAGSVSTLSQAAEADADQLDAATSDDTNPPAQEGPFVPITKPGNHPPDDHPRADDPPRGDNQGDDHGKPPEEIGPPAGNASTGGPPDDDGQGGPDGPNRNPSNGANGGPDGPNENPGHGADGGLDGLSEEPSNRPDDDESSEWDGGGHVASNPAGRAGKGWSK